MPKAPFTQTPEGRAVIETYTVMHGRDGPAYAVLFGRMADSGARFIANTPDDAATLHDLQAPKASAGRAACRTATGTTTSCPSDGVASLERA